MSRGLALAIDTTSEFASLALANEINVLAEVTLHSPDGYGHILFDRIEAFLAANGVQLADIEVFAAAAGPGSFTGVRVGLTAAKGLAAAMGKKASGISTLQALSRLGAGPVRAAVLDARRGEVYAALFDAAGNPLSPETVAKFPDWLARLPKRNDISFVFMDETPFAAALDASAPRVSAGRSLAGAIAPLAWAQAKDPALLDANYVRKSDAELFWTDR